MYQSTEPCPRCGAQNLRGTWVCPHCGNTLVIYCHNCRAANAIGSQFCQSCGSPLAVTSQAPTQTPATQPQPDPSTQVYGAQPYAAPPYGAPPPGQQPYQGYQQYPGYSGYQQYPQPGMLDGIGARLKQIVMTTNPILLSALVVLVVGLSIFLVLAFQFNWIKTGQPVKQAVSTDKRAPVVSLVEVKDAGTSGSAIISWITDEPSSSQVEYGLWPVANTDTPIQDDPTTGASQGVMAHSVTITSLIPKSSYSYKVVSIDKDGNRGESPMMQFDTAQQ